MSDSTTGWTPLQRRLHWWVAGVVCAQALLAWPMGAAVDRLALVAEGEGSASAADFLVSTAHTATGIALALLTLWRLRLRRDRRGQAPARAWWVRLHHGLLYALVLLMSGSGMLFWYAGWAPAAQWHAVGKWLLSAAIAVHVAAATLHAVRGDAVLQGMTGRRNMR